MKTKIVVVKPKLTIDDLPVIPAPATMTVSDYQKPVLWLNDNTVLVRKIGY